MNKEEQKLAMQLIELGCELKELRAEKALLQSENAFLRGLAMQQTVDALPPRFVDRMRTKR